MGFFLGFLAAGRASTIAPSASSLVFLAFAATDAASCCADADGAAEAPATAACACNGPTADASGSVFFCNAPCSAPSGFSAAAAPNPTVRGGACPGGTVDDGRCAHANSWLFSCAAATAGVVAGVVATFAVCVAGRSPDARTSGFGGGGGC